MLRVRSTVITDLARRLRNETRALHADAEDSPLMRLLLAGRLGCAGYCALLRNLHALYAALEPALARHSGAAVPASACDPALARSGHLAADLEALHGPGWALAYPVQPAGRRYVDRLHELDGRRPMLLLAHAYVRYLGDLSGGQLLRRVVGDGLPPGAGHAIAFYDFGSPRETARLARSFREALAALPSEGTLSGEIVGEARMAFAWHRDLFDELAAAGVAQVMPSVGPARVGG